MSWTAGQFVTTAVSVVALVLGILNFVMARRAHRRREELQRRNDRLEADRLLDRASEMLYGQEGFTKTADQAKLNEARNAVDTAGMLIENYSRAVEFQGHLLYVLGNEDAARERYQQSVRLDPSRSQAHRCLGILLQGEARLRSLRRAIECDPTDAAVSHYNVALALEDTRQTEAAKRHLEQAIAQRPKYVDALVRLAAICKESGQLDEARDLCERAVSANPRSVDALVALGCLLAENGEWSEGASWITQAMHLDPKDDYPYAMMAALHADRKEAELALEYFEKAAKIAPTRRLRRDVTQNLVRDMKRLLDARNENPEAP